MERLLFCIRSYLGQTEYPFCRIARDFDDLFRSLSFEGSYLIYYDRDHVGSASFTSVSCRTEIRAVGLKNETVQRKFLNDGFLVY